MLNFVNVFTKNTIFKTEIDCFLFFLIFSFINCVRFLQKPLLEASYKKVELNVRSNISKTWKLKTSEPESNLYIQSKSGNIIRVVSSRPFSMQNVLCYHQKNLLTLHHRYIKLVISSNIIRIGKSQNILLLMSNIVSS